MNKLFSDIRYAFHSILRNRLLSAFTLAVAAVSAIFLNAVLQMADMVYGDNPPFVNADRTVSIANGDFKNKDGRYVEGIKAQYIRGFTKSIRNLEKICVVNIESVMLLAGEHVFPISAGFVSGQYWDMNEFAFTEGRGFTEEESFDAAKVAVVTEGFARRMFGKGYASGNKIEVQGIEYEIIGVVGNYSSFSMADLTRRCG